METPEKSPMFVTLIVISSVTLVIGLILFTVTAQVGYLWWMAGLSVAIGVGALLGSSGPSASREQGFVAIVVALSAYGAVRIPVRLLMGKAVDLGHELELLFYCLSLVVALVAARWISRRGRSKTETV